MTPDQGAGLDPEARKLWARARLRERIDSEIADIEDHRETLDLEAIELDRAGAADIALFDPSREASLARRYEAEARRGFFKALKEFREAEAEVEARLAQPAESKPEREPLGSSWVGPAPTPREPQPRAGERASSSSRPGEAMPRGLNGRQVVAVGSGAGGLRLTSIRQTSRTLF